MDIPQIDDPVGIETSTKFQNRTYEIQETPPTLALPVELLREIAELAASSFPGCIPRLCLISHTFKQWFEPHLYRTLRVDSENIIPPTIINPFSRSDHVLTGPLKRIAPYVRHALIQRRPSIEAENILHFCTKTEKLALWIIDHPSADLVKQLQTLPLRSISMDPIVIFRHNPNSGQSIPFCTPPSFKNLTHFDILWGGHPQRDWTFWKELALMPQLSHLSVNGENMGPVVPDILRHCRRIQMVVLLYYDTLAMEQGAHSLPENDSRLILTTHRYGGVNLFTRWTKAARDEESYWIRAEKLRERRQQEGWLGRIVEPLPDVADPWQ